ncbi:MAG TPA: amidase [Dehalococcoidia bacterium]|nr:amidase [Dehalococcoidia bacterium]
MPDLPLTLLDAADALRAGATTSVELTRGFLARIERLNPTLGAFITVTAEQALAAAAQADADFAAGVDRGPLQGIPLGVKDILATQDAPTTANSNVLDRAWGAGWDAPVVARLRAAGGVILGKLVLSEFALGMPDPDTGFPIPRNPWDLERSASGSSSGTGIAVAAGLILGGIGTDTGGSVRGPASFNGHTGLKVTYGRVPKSGCVPLGYTLDSIGPMARSAADCAAILQVIAGHDPSDPTSSRAPVPDYAATLTGSLEGLRIGVPKAYFFDAPELDPQVKDAVLAAVDRMAAAGARVREVELPHAALAKEANTITMVSEALAYHRQDLASKWTTYGKFTRRMLTRGALYTASDYVQAQRFRSFFKAEVARAMADLDVLVTPTGLTAAEKTGEIDPDKRLLWPSFTGIWNLVGLPALALPCGFNDVPLPLSMQIVGKPFAEDVLLRAGDAYQRLTDWHLRVPPIAAEVAA